MFGTNKITKQNLTKRELVIKSIFYTIQGEGPFAGTPAIFIRFSGCCLACKFCDTDFDGFSYKDEVARILDIVQDTVKINNNHVRLVVLTGGEPLLQRVGLLINALVTSGFDVQIETSGSVWYQGVSLAKETYKDRLTIVTSPKTPVITQGAEKYTDYWKYVVSTSDQLEDGLPLHPPLQGKGAAGSNTRHFLYHPPSHTPSNKIFVQPCDEQVVIQNKLNVALATEIAMKFGYRLSLQQHKILGLD